jgi:thiol-disulfide isomerase/thioredoxin
MRSAFLYLLLLLAACRDAPPADQPAQAEAEPGEADRSRAGSPAPEVTFEDPDGQPARFSDFRGTPLLVNLWATWCAPCVAEMPTLDALAERERDRLQLLTISEDLNGRDKIEAFLGERRFRHLEAWLDPQMELMAAMGVTTLPTTILYDAQGREVWRVTGAEDWTGEEAAALLSEINPSAAR